MSELLKYEIADGVATITLNRPEKMNAFTGEMMDDGVAALEDCRTNAAVRAIVMTGTGRAFTTGGDVESFSGSAKQTPQGHQQRDARRIGRHHRPVGSDSVAERSEALRSLGPRQGRRELLIDLQTTSCPERRLAHISRRIGRSRRPAAIENARPQDPERRGRRRKRSERPQQPAP